MRILLLFVLLFPTVILAQDAPPDLTETFDGKGRLNNITLSYPADWYTLNGVPVNRLVSFNVISSVKIGIRNRIVAGEEAIVLAIAGGRIDRWDSIETDASAEEVLTAVLEQIGSDSEFSGDRPEDEETENELLTEEITFNDYDAVRMRFITEETVNSETEDDFTGEFVAYAILLDENHFMVVLTLTSELTFDEAQPTIEGILDSVVYETDG